jgi:hypothetical protein
MAGTFDNPAVTHQGLLLSREPSGERFLKLALLCEEEGLLVCLLRVSTKPSGTESPPDLFDTAEILLAPPKGNGVQFASEYRVTQRAVALGTDYVRLSAACHWARILTQNPPAPDSCSAVFALCQQALEAFANRPRPDATLFKSLWKLALDGGWPVLEHWFATLPISEKEKARTILRQPLDAQEVPPAGVARLLRDLEQWLAHECHYILPPVPVQQSCRPEVSTLSQTIPHLP